MKSIAVVLLNYNGEELLKKFLPNVVSNSLKAKIYIADNCSSDKSEDFVKNNYPNVEWISLDKNYGYAEGYNKALNFVKEDIYCLLNTDVETTENWLSPILNLFKTDNTIGIIQPKILNFNKKDEFEYAGAAGGFIDKYGFPFCRGRIFEHLEKDHNQYPSQPIFWASGACFFIRKETFHMLNGFDNDFFAHQEEIDLCWRAFNHNIKTYYCNESTVYHVGGATLHKTNTKKTFLNFRNSLYMLYKNVPLKGRFLLLFKRLSWDGLAGVQYILKGKPLHCWAIVKSHFAFYAHMSQLKKKRTKIDSKPNYYTISSIVIDYYIKNKKKYTDL